MNPKPQLLLRVALHAAEKAAQYISNESSKDHRVDFKGVSDLVTQVDYGSEKIILSEINDHFPDHNILTEESGEKSVESLYTWIIDPLDGTTNFVHRYPFYAVSVSVYFKKRPVVGVIVDVYHKHTYSATAGGGAFRNGDPISVSKTRKLQNALLATGFPYIHDTAWSRNFEYFTKFTDLTHGVRRAGSASIDLAHVACGWLDGFWEFGLKPWDSSAGLLIIEEAGGKVSKADGSQFSIFIPDIVASNGHLHTEILRSMKNL